MKPKSMGTTIPHSNSKMNQRSMKERDMNKSKTVKRSIRSFHPNTISIPCDETIGVFSDTVIYTEVIDGATGVILGIPDMELVKSTMRPANRSESRDDGEYYIANFK